MRLHHAAICTRDIERSLVFWRDGLALDVIMDHTFDGDWPTLLRARSSTLRSVFLGDPAAPEAGVVELVDFGTPMDASIDNPADRAGFLLLSFNVDLDATLARLDASGMLPDPPRQITEHGVRMAVIYDPDGVQVELVDLPAIDLGKIGAAASSDRRGG